MHKNRGPVYYGDYLKLNQLLGSQEPLSKKYNPECHDEMLFIVVHQVYELWFKQILHEMNHITKVFSQKSVSDQDLAGVNLKLERIEKIQDLLLDQLPVLETMTPMDFLEFRDLLVPASGFQSAQFRKIEIGMGLSTKNRTEVDRDYFLGRLNEQDRNELLKIEEMPSLFDLMEKWLERLPFASVENYSFWNDYQATIAKMLAEDEKIINNNLAKMSEKEREAQLANLEATKRTFASLASKEDHDKLIAQGKRRLSHKATLHALFILLYRDEPMLQQPFGFLTHLMNIDENFTTWRYRHSIMAQRMLGTKIGTGGSSGHHYLKMAAENNRVYIDLFNLSTFLVPKSLLPELPAEVAKKVRFS